MTTTNPSANYFEKVTDQGMICSPVILRKPCAMLLSLSLFASRYDRGCVWAQGVWFSALERYDKE